MARRAEGADMAIDTDLDALERDVCYRWTARSSHGRMVSRALCAGVWGRAPTLLGVPQTTALVW